MVRFFYPDWYFESYTRIPPDFFKKRGIRYLICDIDNTLVTYDDPLPTPSALAFFHRLKEEGVRLILVSNNNEQRVRTFVGERDLLAVPRACKPLKHKIQRVLSPLSPKKQECAVMGDQILTDGLVAKNLGVPMILLDPIKSDKGMPFFKLKRALERFILKQYLKKHRQNDELGRREPREKIR